MGDTTTRKRKLAAVLFADMVGYTERSGRNEALALELVEELRAAVSSATETCGGRMVKSMGDGFLLTFESGLEAARCARSIQQALAGRNADAPPEKQVQVRIGLHLGDVEERGGDVFGNGVNLAARVLSIASPGEACMTQPVFDQLDPELKASVVTRGYQTLKDFPDPLMIYAIGPPSVTALRRRNRSPLVSQATTVAVMAFVLVAGTMWFGPRLRFSNPVENSAMSVLLAVLPLNNVSHDSDLEAFSHGLMETLTAELTRVGRYQAGLQIIPSAEVLTRNIASPAEAVKFFRVNRVLTGSLQRQGREVKVLLTLEDSGSHKALNSASAVRSLDDAFGLQEELTAAALNLLNLNPPKPLLSTPRGSRTENGAAYLAYLKGLGLLARFDREPDLEAAQAQFEVATRLDPAFALAHAGLAEACWRRYERTGDLKWKDRAESEATLAREADLPRVHAVLGLIASKTGKLDEAIAEFRRAAEQSPASPDAQLGLALAYANSGRDQDAERTYLRAIQQSTNYWAGYNGLASFYLSRGHLAPAEKYYVLAVKVTPDNYLVACNLGGLYYFMGRNAEARKELVRSIELHPNAEAYSNLGTLDFAEHNYAAAGERFEQAVKLGANEPMVWGNLADALRLAGKPSDEVTATYERALELTRIRLRVNPKDATRQALLAYYLAYAGEADKAVATADEARRLSPNDVMVTYTAALAYEQAGKRALAIEALRQAAAAGYSPSEILGNPDLSALRADASFKLVQDSFNTTKGKEKGSL